MKKFILICGFLVAGLVANAQTATTAERPDAVTRAKQMTANMEQKLALTPDQKPKVAEINMKRATAIDALMKNGNKATLEDEKKKVIATWKNELAKVLTKEQLTKLEKAMANRQRK